LIIQALFLVICLALAGANLADKWTIAGAAIAGFAPLLAFVQDPANNFDAFDCGFLTLLLSNAGLIAIVVAYRQDTDKSKGLDVLLGLALFVTWVGEWSWFGEIFLKGGLNDAPMFVSPRIP